MKTIRACSFFPVLIINNFNFSKRQVAEIPSYFVKAETGSPYWATPVPMAPRDVSYPTVIPMETVE